MRSRDLDVKDLLALAGVKGKSKEVLKLAKWVSNNLVLLEDDCPDCGQAAPTDCDWCEGCENPECKCVCDDP